MALLDFLGLLIVAIGIVCGSVYAYVYLRTHAHPHIPSGNKTAVSDYPVVEAVRILNEIHHQDKIVPILTRETREAVEKYLRDYYSRAIK
jgi:hypothetical protein